MSYIIALVGGIICGAIAPPGKRSIFLLLATGVVLLLAVSIVAMLVGHDGSKVLKLLTLEPLGGGDWLGLIGLSGIAYMCITGSLVVGFRYLVGRK